MGEYLVDWWVDWEPEWYRECEEFGNPVSFWAPDPTPRSLEGAERARKPQAEVPEQYYGIPKSFTVIELPPDYYREPDYSRIIPSEPPPEDDMFAAWINSEEGGVGRHSAGS